ncbi:DUF2244 domain-containing protein [Pacificimonas sp. WHA3]|uniref:DUF2244 domain-containing protein n=1 Tax=Pacificimonas pallii TaxID=2827236 RepID=A0ABS6SDJ5_9SPHN|nr:DUF2244 domain-containing protein [Pacificimonas pallii]MBV7255917.1 DUF2244 domain-containing protein [Pacificimonas pallii]
MDRLDLTLRPPPPLGYKHALIVIGATALVMAFAAVRFWFLGAWLVLPFLAIDLALLIWAFRASARGSKAFERLRVGVSEVRFDRVAPCGAMQSWTLPRNWTRVQLEKLSPPTNRLWLTHKDRKLLIGKHLSAREREDVYGLIRRELS